MEDAVRNNKTALTLPKVLTGTAPEPFIKGSYTGLEWLEVGKLRIPGDDEGAALVPYRGPRGSFPYFSLADVWSDKVPVESLKGRIALIGTAAPSRVDLRSAPADSVYPRGEMTA